MPNHYFAEIILPLALPGTFTYQIISDQFDQLQVGHRVAVPFGTNKLYTGIVYSIHQEKPELFKTKFIDSVLDEEPYVLPTQIKFWEWVADYYLCTLGEVYRAAVPSALKWESETFIKLVDHQNLDELSFSEQETKIINLIDRKGIISLREIQELTEDKSTIKWIKSLWEKNVIKLDEVLHEKYKPKIELYVKINQDLHHDEKRFGELLDGLKNATKQRELVLQLIVWEKQTAKPVKISAFIKSFGGTHSIFKILQQKGLVEIYELQTSRIENFENEIEEIHSLNLNQISVLNAVKKSFSQQQIVSLNGITSSGKTEIYIQLIKEKLKEKKSILVLVPEIGIANHMVDKIQRNFGEIVGVYHSKFNQSERAELWKKALNNEYKILIGARSSIFLPLQNLGLIIIDEEHDPNYKQADSLPYFNARDMSIVLADLFKANVLLGSATPSLETYYNSTIDRYDEVKLTKRYGNFELPEIELIDLRKALGNKEISGDITHQLRDEIQNQIHQGKQVILFQNRRGYAPVLECTHCGNTPYCPNCDVTLTFHKKENKLKCHYCGYQMAKPTTCPSCKSPDLNSLGIGTEQIEFQLRQLFPQINIARMDADTMRGKHAFEKALYAFEQQEIDILVGTQMIAKGIDFSNVGLVGVIRADSLLNIPDFRAHERAFQLLVQLAGRAGRRDNKSKVLIQTYNPQHTVLQHVCRYDFEANAKEILSERQNFGYPPYLRLIRLTLKHGKLERVEKVSHELYKLLKPYFDEKHLLGPDEPPIARIRNQYIRHILIKIPPEKSVKSVKNVLKQKLNILQTVSAFRSVKIEIDVDPY